MFKKNFWDKKIIRWEKKNYDPVKRSSFFKNPVQARLHLASKILCPQINNKDFLDLGCGSGRLVDQLTSCGARKIYGIDLSHAAIQSASARYQEKSNISFFQEDVICSTWPRADVICGLGLTDWLSDNELEVLFSKLQDSLFLFSFSEKTFHIDRYLHQSYVFFSYGWRNPQYVPRYYPENKIRSLAKKYGHGELYFLRKTDLAFGTFFANFPINI